MFALERLLVPCLPNAMTPPPEEPCVSGPPHLPGGDPETLSHAMRALGVVGLALLR